MEKEKRNEYIDIIKAIGIISIVIGHSCWTITQWNILIGPFVYSYHLMIFLVVSGFLYNEDKVHDKKTLLKYLWKQTIKMVKLFFLYNLFFVLIHNILLRQNLITGNIYTGPIMIKNILNGLRFITNERFLGAFWFIPMMLIAKILFSCTHYFTKKRKMLMGIIMMLYGILGVILCINQISLPYRMQISILSVFFIFVGLVMKRHWQVLEKYVFSFGWIPSGIILYLILYFTKSSIDLSVNKIINPWLFFLLTFIGVYFCFSLAMFIVKSKKATNFFSLVGKNSMHIMALHFLVIKVIDIIYCHIHRITDIKVMTKFPYAFNIWYYYIPLAVLVPVIIVSLPKIFKRKRKDQL